MMTHPSRMVSHQSTSSCIAWLRVLVPGGCRVRGSKRAIIQHVVILQYFEILLIVMTCFFKVSLVTSF